MLLTKEDDYAIRILRALRNGDKRRGGDICQEEDIPEAFGYKIIRKLQQADILNVERGVKGGCRLQKDLQSLTLYDVITAINEEPAIMPCLRQSCSRNRGEHTCKVHEELMKIQRVMVAELKVRPLSQLF